MDNIKKILFESEENIVNSLDSLMLEVKDNIENKNRKIQELANKPKLFIFHDKNYLKELKKYNLLLKYNLVKNNPKNKKCKIVLLYDIESLKDFRKNNKLFKLLIKNILKIKKDNRKLKKAISDNSNKSTINTKDMSAFKLIALELEEKEKMLKESSMALIEKDDKIANLENEIVSLNNNLNKLNEEINVLSLNNKELSRINDLQIKTITKLENDIKDKVNNINELKEYFLKLMEKYNDILVEVY